MPIWYFVADPFVTVACLNNEKSVMSNPYTWRVLIILPILMISFWIPGDIILLGSQHSNCGEAALKHWRHPLAACLA
jgi:hypothetical protein